MKSFRYILAISLSLLTVFAGVGISITDYCCSECEAEQSCCVSGCKNCWDHADHFYDKTCKDDGCVATIYKVELTKHSCEISVSAPVIELFCSLLPDVRHNFFFAELQNELNDIPPEIISARCYLALYSTFLI